MFKKFAMVLFGLCCALQPAIAQTDQPGFTSPERWMTFGRAAADGGPLIVLARTGNALAEMLLHEARATVVTCRADPANVNEQGMPQGTERLYALEDKLAAEPALLAARAIHVASVTGQGQRRLFVVHPDPLDLTPLLAISQVRGFSCEASDVDDRQALIQLITPTPLEIQLNGDLDVLASLRQVGDDGLIPRKTDFWFYGEAEAVDALVAGLASYGFGVDQRLRAPDGVVLSREMPVVWSEFQALTPAIVAAVERSGVEYDGWETMVISKSATRPSDNQKP